MNTPNITVAINHAKFDMTSAISLTDNILPAITLLIPNGVNHMTPVTIFIITSNMTVKKSIIALLLSPRVPNIVPNIKQKKTMPKVLVPDLLMEDFYCNECKKSNVYSPIMYLPNQIFGFGKSTVFRIECPYRCIYVNCVGLKIRRKHQLNIAMS